MQPNQNNTRTIPFMSLSDAEETPKPKRENIETANTRTVPFMSLSDQAKSDPADEKGKKSTLGSVARGVYNTATAVPELVELAKKIVDYPAYGVAKVISGGDSKIKSPFETPTQTSKLTNFLEKKGLLQESSLGKGGQGFVEAATQGAAFGALGGPVGSVVGAGLSLVGEGVSQVTGSPLLGAAAEISLGVAPKKIKSLSDVFKKVSKSRASKGKLPQELKDLGKQFEQQLETQLKNLKSSRAHIEPKNLSEFKSFDATELLPEYQNYAQKYYNKLGSPETAAFKQAKMLQDSINNVYKQRKFEISKDFQNIADSYGDIRVNPEQMKAAEQMYGDLRKGLAKSIITSPEESASRAAVSKLEKAFRTKPKTGLASNKKLQSLFNEDLETFISNIDSVLGSDKLMTREALTDLHETLGKTVLRPRKIDLDNLMKTNITLGSMINYETIEPAVKNMYLRPAKKINENLIKQVLLDNGMEGEWKAFSNAQQKYMQLTDDFYRTDIRKMRKTDTPSQAISMASTPESLEKLKKVSDPSMHPMLDLEYIKQTTPQLKTTSKSYIDKRNNAKEVLSPDAFDVWESVVKEGTFPKSEEVLAQETLKMGQHVVESIANGEVPQKLLNRIKDIDQYKHYKKAFNKTGKNSEIWKTIESQFIDQVFGSLESNRNLNINTLDNLIKDKRLLSVVEEIAGKGSVDLIKNMQQTSFNIANTLKKEKEAADVLSKMKDSNILGLPTLYGMHLVAPNLLTPYVGGKLGIEALQMVASDKELQSALKALAKPDLSPKSTIKLLNAIRAREIRNENNKKKRKR